MASASPFIVDTLGVETRPALLPNGQFLSSHSRVCMGARGESISLRSVSINKGVVTMDIHGRVLQTGAVEVVRIY